MQKHLNRYINLKDRPMVRKQATIQNKMGIHVRPTGVIIDAFHDSRAEIRIEAKGLESDLKDHIGLLAMGLCKGDTVEISVSGENEEEICSRVKELFEREFDFPPRQ